MQGWRRLAKVRPALLADDVVFVDVDGSQLAAGRARYVASPVSQQHACAQSHLMSVVHCTCTCVSSMSPLDLSPH